MADGALHITRDQLAAALGNNPRAIRLIESLMLAVRDTLPASMSEVEQTALLSLLQASGGKSAAIQAEGVALEVQALTAACQRQAADLQALRDQVDLLRLELHAARASLLSAIGRAQADASQALTLTIGA